MKGLDVSLFQGVIDWKKVKKDGYGFAMIKVSQGKDVDNPYSGCFEDPKFRTNIVNASDAGLLCGTYHYLCAINEEEAKTEAQFFCDAMKPYKDKIKLWASVDVEDVYPPQYCGTVDKDKLTRIVRTFCSVVKANGFKPMLYSNTNYMTYHFNYNQLKDIPLWYANWYSGSGWTEADKPVRDFSYKIWQYGYCYTSGIGNGQSGVDGDFGYFTQADINGDDEIREGDIIGIKSDAYYYGTDIFVPDFVIERDWIVEQVIGDRVYFDKSADGLYSINSAVAIEDCYLVAHPAEPVCIEAGDVVAINDGACYYGTSIPVPESILSNSWYVDKVYEDNTALINKSVEGGWEINSILSIDDLTLVEKAPKEVEQGETEPEPDIPDIGGGEVGNDEPQEPEPVVEEPPVETPTEPEHPTEPTPTEPIVEEPKEDEKETSVWLKILEMINGILISIKNFFSK